MEETLFVTERRQKRTEIASHLRSIADKLDAGEAITLSNGGESVTVEVPEQAAFEMEVERETGDSDPELSFEFEIEWHEEGESSGFVIE